MNEVLHSLMLTLHLIMKEARNILLGNNMNKQGEGEEKRAEEAGEERESCNMLFIQVIIAMSELSG